MNFLNEHKAILVLFKDFLANYNSRNLSKIIGISHPGMFKLLKKLEKRGILKSLTIGKAIVYSLNFKNPLTINEIEIALILESHKYSRWIEEFKDLSDLSEFVVLFGSVLKDEKSAKDIDLLVVSDKDKFSKIKKVIKEKNSLLSKKIHLILQSVSDFKKDISDKNKVMIDILKTGVVLSGYDTITKILGDIK